MRFSRKGEDHERQEPILPALCVRALILEFGIATEPEVDIDTLASRLQKGIVSQRGVARGPGIISAWTRVGSHE